MAESAAWIEGWSVSFAVVSARLCDGSVVPVWRIRRRKADDFFAGSVWCWCVCLCWWWLTRSRAKRRGYRQKSGVCWSLCWDGSDMLIKTGTEATSQSESFIVTAIRSFVVCLRSGGRSCLYIILKESKCHWEAVQSEFMLMDVRMCAALSETTYVRCI